MSLFNIGSKQRNSILK